MIFEHFALNVSEPLEMADWFVEHCQSKIVSRMEEPPHMTFLADKSGRVFLELYKSTRDPVPDYTQQHPIRTHLAFEVGDPLAERARLEQAGCTFFEEVRKDDGSLLIMMRNPWGVPIQLCKRGTPFAV